MPPASTASLATATTAHAQPAVGPRYKWIALSNTTLGVLMATINSSIMLIALPDIFRGIGINPLQPGNTTILLWMIMGFLVVTAVLVVSFGRLGDMFGRVRMYNMGFAIFALFSILLSVSWLSGSAAGWYLIAMRIFQGVGGAMLIANSSAILTDAFPANQRGMALGLNQVAGIAGSFIGLVLGGLLGPVDWRLVFLVSVPVGVLGTVWSYLKLKELGVRKPAKLDWWGNLTFAAGLIAVLVGITYGIQPYGGHVMGWTSPLVMSLIFGGIVVLLAFCYIETQVAEPMFRLSLFRIRPFTAGNVASLLSGLGRGGLMFILIIWLQGIYLPMHGYNFADTPLWAGIAMLPLTVGFLVAGPISGLPVRQVRRAPVRHRRHAGRRPVIPAARAPAGELQLPGVRGHPVPQRRRHGPVRLAEQGRHHELAARQPPRRRRRHVGHVPELVHGAVDRHLLQPDHPRPVVVAGRPPVHRPDRAGRARRGRPPAVAPAADGGHVRRAARLQPDPDAARPGAHQAAGQQRGLPDRPLLLPEPDLRPVPRGPVRRVRLRDRGLPDRRRRLAAARQALRAR